MLMHLLPFTSAFAQSTNTSYGLSLYVPDSGTLNCRMRRVIIDAISIVAICYSVLKFSQKKGEHKAMFFAIVLMVVAVMIPRLFMSQYLEKHCAGCPSNAMMSMSIVYLILSAAFVYGVAYML